MYISPADYQISFGEHGHKSVIWLAFPYDRERVTAIKSAGAKWSATAKCWYLPDGVHFKMSRRVFCDVSGIKPDKP